jgi:hypothetical protein
LIAECCHATGSPNLEGLGSEALAAFSEHGYDAYLRSDWWQYLRNRLLNTTCLGCWKEPACVLHHISYANKGSEKPEDLVPLCKECHKKLHKHLCKQYPDMTRGRSAAYSGMVWKSLFGVELDEATSSWRSKFYSNLTCPDDPADEENRPRKRTKWVCEKCGGIAIRHVPITVDCRVVRMRVECAKCHAYIRWAPLLDEKKRKPRRRHSRAVSKDAWTGNRSVCRKTAAKKKKKKTAVVQRVIHKKSSVPLAPVGAPAHVRPTGKQCRALSSYLHKRAR